MAGKSDVPLLQFAYSKDKGYHVGMGVKPSGDESKGERRRQQLINIATKVFGGQRALKHKEAVTEIEERIGCGTSTAKKALADMRDAAIIYQDDLGWYRLGQN